MATLRDFLNESGFDWTTGRIIYHPTKDDDTPGWDTLDKEQNPHLLSGNSAILDKPFSAGHGGPECPRYIAEDNRAIYFPSQYDGATHPEVILKDLNVYFRGEAETPYPGG